MVLMGFGASAQAKSWTRSEVMKEADQYLKQLGYDAEQYSVTFDYTNSHWAYFMKEERPNKDQFHFKYESKNTDKYWIINYMALDGSGQNVWLFMDRDTGSIDNFIQGRVIAVKN